MGSIANDMRTEAPLSERGTSPHSVVVVVKASKGGRKGTICTTLLPQVDPAMVEMNRGVGQMTHSPLAMVRDLYKYPKLITPLASGHC